MALKPFLAYTTQGEPGGSTTLDRLIQSLVETFNSLRSAVTNDRIIQAYLDTGEVKVYHGLSSQPTAIDVVGLDAGEAVYESPGINRNRDKYVIMLATGPVTARLRFT